MHGMHPTPARGYLALDYQKEATHIHLDATGHITTQPQGHGRPSTFTPDLIIIIITRISEGTTLAELCADTAMPNRATINKWLQEREDFRAALSHAREAAADGMVREAWELLGKATKETASVAREQAAHLRWRAARMAPQAYGDRVQIGGHVTHEHTINDRKPDWLKARVAHVAAPLLDHEPTPTPHDDDDDDPSTAPDWD